MALKLTANDENTAAREKSLTEDVAASLIGYSPAALRLWRREGRGPCYLKHGRSIRYLPQDLRAWEASHRVTPSAEGARPAGAR